MAEGSTPAMPVTNVVSAVIVGLVVGVLGRLLLPGRQRIGVFVTFVIGVGAALLGAYVATVLGIDRAPASKAGQEWARWAWLRNLSWDWIVLAVQLGFAVLGTAIAAAVWRTRVAYKDPLDRATIRSRPR
jgi:uncharacterized membrane protein YeaQ/YmgE (transglycosylase-associated protein family)